MSQITRCPHCATWFKVRPEQLRSSGGWVRCGQCQAEFDAAASLLPADVAASAVLTDSPAYDQEHSATTASSGAALQLAAAETSVDEPMPPLAVAPAGEPAALRPFESSTQATIDPPREPVAALSDGQAVVAASDAGAASAGPETEAAADDPPWVEPMPGALSQGEDVVLPAAADDRPAGVLAADAAAETKTSEPAAAPEGSAREVAAEPVAASVPGVSLEAVDTIDAAPVAVAPVPLAPELSFVQQVERRAFWSSRWVRLALMGLAGLLSVALLLQWTWSRRDWLATVQPSWHPVLQALCQPVGCTVRPLQRLDAIVIDGSTFSRSAPSVYRLTYVLRNRADIPVGGPTLELSLTDAQNQTLVRRVLQRGELAVPEVLQAQQEFNGNAELRLTNLPNSDAIVGYRLIAFYP